MRNFLVIARREYLERVKTRAFIIMTLLLPLLMIAATVILRRRYHWQALYFATRSTRAAGAMA